MKRKIKLVIFDLDGTLVNAYAAVVASINFTLRTLGLPLRDRNLIRRSVGWGDTKLLKRFVGEDAIQKALTIYRRHHAGALKHGTKFLPGAYPLLQDLKKQKYQLAIASNRPTRFSLIILRYLKIRKLFNVVLCADKLKRGKPDPRILKVILKKMKVKPQEALYVGDMTIDVETGKRADVKTVAVLTGSSTKREVEALRPSRVIRKISDLRMILKEE